GALGSFVGAWIVGYLNGLTGGPGASYMFMAISLVLAVFLTMMTSFSTQQTTTVKARAY
ncbi:TPA: MFS transporter, partial [Raoultella planticola]